MRLVLLKLTSLMEAADITNAFVSPDATGLDGDLLASQLIRCR